MEPYQQTIDQIEQHFSTHRTSGLTTHQVDERLRMYGANHMPLGLVRSWYTIFFKQFNNPLIYLLVVSAALIFFIGNDHLEPFIIIGVLLFNAIIGTIQEGKAESIVASLHRFIKTECVVIRNGVRVIVPERDLVPGDLIFIQEGQCVPADARLLLVYDLCVDESVLTGEAGTQYKVVAPLTGDKGIAEQDNMVFKGTYIMSGSGYACVVATGIKTQFGMINKVVTEINTEPPLYYKMEQLSYQILWGAIIACISLFLIGWFLGKSLTELFVMLTALFICIVPEGLPIIVMLVLISSAYRLARCGILVRNLVGVEGLGRVNVVILDKTGTLTKNELMVSLVCTASGEYRCSGQGYCNEGALLYHGAPINHDQVADDVRDLAIASRLMNNAEIIYIEKYDTFEVKGDPTEASLAIFAHKVGVDDLLRDVNMQKIGEIPFDQEKKMHVGFFSVGTDDDVIAYMIGAPEALLARTQHQAAFFTKELHGHLDDGLRMVGVAKKIIARADWDRSVADSSASLKMVAFDQWLYDIQLLGLLGMQDTLRTDAAEAIEGLRELGIQVIMATGDHLKTAEYIARQVDLYRIGDMAINGTALSQFSDHELTERISGITVYGRLSPDQKMRIIKAFHDQGLLVAMTGDGINDVPSLVVADIGIAMGKIGTEVAKRASDLVLLQDSLVAMVYGVKEGRHVFICLRRIMLYFFSTNLGEFFIILFALMAGYPLPITPGQILWLNLVTDGFLNMSLSMEPIDESELHHAQTRNNDVLIDRKMVLVMMVMAVTMGLGSVYLFSCYYQQDIRYARTVTMITMVLYQWFNAWNCRSFYRSLFTMDMTSNRWLLGAAAFVLFLQWVMVYTQPFQFVFSTVPLSLYTWLEIGLVAGSIVLVEEIRKGLVRRFM